MNFTHLHVHSRYSFLDGLNSSDELVETANEKGFGALALTDHGNISGWIQHYRACKEYGIKPILGIEGYFVDDATKKEKGQDVYHIVLLAKSNLGIKSMFRLLTRAHDHYYYRPRIDLSMLQEAKDLIVLTACGYKGLLNHPNYERLCYLINESFPGDFYLELMPLDLDFQKKANEKALRLHGEMRIPIVVTNDVHYRAAEDSVNHNFLLRMNTKGKYDGFSEGFCLRTKDEMVDAFHKHCPYIDDFLLTTAFQSTSEIADKCEITLDEREIVLPHMADDPYLDLEEKAKRLLRWKLGSVEHEWKHKYWDRLNYELDIVKDKDFANYFLLVSDFCDYARASDFEMPVGRGSSGGSLLCYVLGITQLDPIHHNLLFERFLNPERSDWPDIDLDFEDERRGEILAYLKRKYGDDHVANISTYAELLPRSAFKDVAKSVDFKVSHVVTDEITKSINNDLSVAENLEEDGGLKDRIRDLPNWGQIVKYADAITGCYRQPGRHAAGIVVSPGPLDEISVLERRGDDRVVNWGMDEASYLGLVKVDILGLRTLSVIAEARRLIEQQTHTRLLYWDEIDLEGDSKVLREFSLGHTIGVMQFESHLQRQLLRDLAPIESVSTIIDCNALGRPGPLDSGMTEAYIKRKTGKEEVVDTPYAEWIKSITTDTYGVIVYQEQIIEILRQIAGYSIPKADSMRRVIAKSKGYEEFEKHKEEFVGGCKETSDMPQAVATLLFNDLQKYSRYSFNKSHATAYTITALRQMWLKVHHKVEYMTALLRKTDDKDKINQFVNECHRLNIGILDVSINDSETDFSIKDGKLLIGLRSIKGVGPAAVKAVVGHRDGKPYESLQDFRIRNPKSVCNKGVLNSLVLAGAFDELGVNHRVVLEHLDWLDKYIALEQQSTFLDFQPEGLYSPDGDYDEETKQKNKLMLLEGIAKPKVEIGMILPAKKLEKLMDMIRDCHACELRKHYDCPVPSEWHLTSQVMVIGEAPGYQENKEGHPFVGKAGQVLIKALTKIGLPRRRLYISNCWKCRPLDNALPKDVSTMCFSYLKKEIELINPKLIIACGNSPLKFLTGEKYGITKKNGELEAVNLDGRFYPVFYLLHPASCLHNASNRTLFNEAINQLNKLLKESGND